MTRSQILMATLLLAVPLQGCEQTPQAEAQMFFEDAAACVQEQREYLLEIIRTRPQGLQSLVQDEMEDLCEGLSIENLSDEARLVVDQVGEAIVDGEIGQQLMEALMDLAFEGRMTEPEATSLLDMVVEVLLEMAAGVDDVAAGS